MVEWPTWPAAFGLHGLGGLVISCDFTPSVRECVRFASASWRRLERYVRCVQRYSSCTSPCTTEEGLQRVGCITGPGPCEEQPLLLGSMRNPASAQEAQAYVAHHTDDDPHGRRSVTGSLDGFDLLHWQCHRFTPLCRVHHPH